MQSGEKSLLRFVTTGSVDDGKSTLIGRLLYETKSIYEDQYEAIKKTSKKRGFKEVDLAYLLDGLAAEREQGITIDVAYRYFETEKRKYIITDSPGHVQYTRNMVTGASKADCAVILIDARNGVLTQSKRHGFLISLLQIPHLIVAVNKMDLVDYSQDVFSCIVSDYEEFSQKLDIHDIVYIPVSALKGDNVVSKSKKMSWYEGTTLLHNLENLNITADRNLVDFRFPVQYVVRPNADFRGFAGKIVSGTITPSEEVVVLPSGQTTSVKSIVTYDGELKEAFAPQSVVLTLNDEVDVSRGDMIVRRKNLPQIETKLEAIICWMDDNPMKTGTSFIMKHTTRSVRAVIKSIVYRIDVNTLHRDNVDMFSLNDIGRVEITLATPVFFDPYKINHATGRFILIDPLTDRTVAAGMIRDAARHMEDYLAPVADAIVKQKKSPHTVWRESHIGLAQREQKNGHKAVVLWFTGLSGAGKSTIAMALERRLFERGCKTAMLDGDIIRHGLCSDLAFSPADRKENIRRAGETAKLFFEHGSIVLCTFISPFRADRNFVKSLLAPGRFVEIYVKCSLDECQRRDPNGLYEKARSGIIPGFTGIDSPYEEPEQPEIVIDTRESSVDECVTKLEAFLLKRKVISEPKK
ncbi:MAG TPA: sulfate adenylyltransferase subunit CysN [Smithellaceae bacterium]|jgi:bifunctional enzyme CysN/CysC|nr:sulfate adenylyltransferase subunit CysN [Syntrophaceae bacterium]MDX9815364.1 sulfate adenylyltransferase subunit CysN [Smithellaceae bacterium]MBP8609041.1 sulfate adenylyltransferase subunit CysN [Syntrophaceae bacterium]HNZ31033.1 sulfate adenylyltransferase subunit CysN [Smithellaceae bacterium]HOF77973.1 sulfate adenylyltransferase subunit CysN [Smithellaceae bacterium]